VFDHVTIRVSDLAASEAFHSTVLRTLGVEPLHRGDDRAGHGTNVEAVNHNH
jgi:catechol 2,3-dioxygenase-like lactoylglutathione lyase family enzyme